MNTTTSMFVEKLTDWIKNLSSQITNGNLTEKQVEDFLNHKNPFIEKKDTGSKIFYLKSIHEQLYLIWRHIFPNFSIAEEYLESLILPPDADGWVVIPKLFRLSKLTSKDTFAKRYFNATTTILKILGRRYRFENELIRKFNSQYMRLNSRTQEAFLKFHSKVPGSFFAIPVQVGNKYDNVSVHMVKRGFDDNEFGLCPYMTACMILCHPETIIGEDSFNIECVGMNSRDIPKGKFENNPAFSWSEKNAVLKLDHSLKTTSGLNFRPVTGFYPVNGF